MGDSESFGIEKGYGSELPVKKLNVQYFRDRLRLGSDPEAGKSDHWFTFGPRSYDPPKKPNSFKYYTEIASSVLPYMDEQADKWWNAC